MKHIKVRAELSGGRVNLTLLQMTHSDLSFGNSCPEGPHSWKSIGMSFNHGKYSLISHPRGEEFRMGQGTNVAHNWFILPNTYKSALKTRVTLEQWKWIKEAIEKYNEWGATQK